MSYAQILGWHDHIVPPSVQIFSQGSYFIFNCGENSQRFRLSNRLGLAKIKYIFITNLSAHAFNGLPSFILSLDGCNTSHVTIFGPSPIKKIIETLLTTFHELTIEVTIKEVDHEEARELVKYNSLTIYGFSYKPHLESNYNIEPIHRTNIGYFVQFDEVPGTFDPELAKKYGVSKGPDFGKLKKGLDVTLPDGSVVKSGQVCDEPIPGNQILIVDHDFDFSSIKNLNLDQNRLVYTFYLHTGTTHPSSREVVCNQTQEPLKYIALPSYYKRNMLYHSIFPNIFPGICLNLTEGTNNPSTDVVKDNHPARESVYPPLTKFYVHPPKKVTVDFDDCLPSSLKVEQSDFERVELDLDSRGPKLTFLGTGCSVPSVYRNVSSIMLQIYENYSILLDAGEGTVLQIFYTCSDFNEFIQRILSIRIVFISHSHADHHLGLYYLLAIQNKFRKDNCKTIVVCSEVIMLWLKTYNENISRLEFETMVLEGDSERVLSVDKTTLKLTFFKVDHIFDSFGIRIDHEEVGSVVYSGDTRPCDNLIKHSQKADILIHESTFTDEYQENAIKNFHTTISEAIEIAVASNVRNLFVTHFSQRFQTIPNVYKQNFNLVMAADLMTIPIMALNDLGTHLKRFDLIVKDLIK